MVTGLPSTGPSWRTNNSCDEPLMRRLSPAEIHESSVVFMEGTLGLLDQVWVAAHDLVEYWLRLEPSGRRSANEPAGLYRHIVRYQFWRSRRHRRQLHLAGAFHRDEPPNSLGDSVADGEEAVVLQNNGLVGSERRGQTHSLVEVVDQPVIVVIYGVVLVEGTCVLGKRVEVDSQGGERPSVLRMRMRR